MRVAAVSRLARRSVVQIPVRTDCVLSWCKTQALNTTETGDVHRGSHSTQSSRHTNSGDIKERLERLESPLPVYCGN